MPWKMSFSRKILPVLATVGQFLLILLCGHSFRQRNPYLYRFAFREDIGPMRLK